MDKKCVLVTGGLGYIGSHTVVVLINEGYDVVIVDNLSNSDKMILDRITAITSVRPIFYESDLFDIAALHKIFIKHSFDIVIHFAALKSVAESVINPLLYFRSNLTTLTNVLQMMKDFVVKNIIFSSSATVYGEPDVLPVTECSPFKESLSAYGSTKQICEEMLRKVTADSNIQNISLRYFNPVGAHSSGLIGELPKNIPNNAFPYIMKVAACKLEKFTVFGNDYNTPDGSCLRDYLHVVDLAKVHVQSCKRLLAKEQISSYEVFNIGTGNAYSVIEIIAAFERISGKKLNYEIGPRRDGDVAAIYADVTKANNILGWKAELGLEEMIKSSWQWEKNQA